MSAAFTNGASKAVNNGTVVHITVPLTGSNAQIVEATMPSIVHALEATRARLMDHGQDGVKVRFCVTLGQGAVANVVQHPSVRAARPVPAEARVRNLDEIVWWLACVESELRRVARDCDGGSGQLEDTAGSTALVTHAVKALVKTQCAAMTQHTSKLREHLLFTRTYLSTDTEAVAAQAMLDAAPTHPDDVPAVHEVATIRADAHRGVTWTGNPVSQELLDGSKGLKLDANAWRAFVPESMHAAAHFAHAASERDMPTPILTREQRDAVKLACVDNTVLREMTRAFAGFDMLLVQLGTPWMASEVPLRTTEEVFAFGKCAAQYMMRMLRYPTSAENDASSAVNAAVAWASRDASRLTLLPEGVPPPAVVHWNVVPSDAPWTEPTARKFARVLNTAACAGGYPQGTSPVIGVFFPTSPSDTNVLARALKQHAPAVVHDTPPLVTDIDDEERGSHVESKAAAGGGSRSDEPTPLEVAFCSLAAVSTAELV